VAVNSYAYGITVLQAGATLADRGQTELVAVFVEDEELMHLAALPFVREIDSACARPRSLDAQRMRLAQRSEMARLQDWLHAQGRGSAVRFSMQVVRGRLLREGLDVASAMDIVLLAGEGHPSPRRAPGAVMAMAPPGQPAVGVLFDGSSAARRALDFAEQLAASEHGSLLVLLDGDGSQDEADLQAQVRRLLPGGDTPLRFVSAGMSEELAGHPALRQCQWLVAARSHGTPRGNRTLRLLMRGSGAPLVLVP
jgi:hypothetical protein